MAAMGRGQVKKANTTCGPMYFFPREYYDQTKAWTMEEKFEQGQVRDQLEFPTYSKAIESFIQPWEGGGAGSGGNPTLAITGRPTVTEQS